MEQQRTNLAAIALTTEFDIRVVPPDGVSNLAVPAAGKVVPLYESPDPSGEYPIIAIPFSLQKVVSAGCAKYGCSSTWCQQQCSSRVLHQSTIAKQKEYQRCVFLPKIRRCDVGIVLRRINRDQGQLSTHLVDGRTYARVSIQNVLNLFLGKVGYPNRLDL